jgi:hypothetical protein
MIVLQIYAGYVRVSRLIRYVIDQTASKGLEVLVVIVIEQR